MSKNAGKIKAQEDKTIGEHHLRYAQAIADNSKEHLEDTKRALFHYKKVKKGTPNLTSLCVHSIFTIVLIKQIFEKNKSLRALSRSRTQF